MKIKRPVILTREDWVEIYYALDTKAKLIEDGDYGESMCDHGEDCTACDKEWVAHLRRIMATIGDDGEAAIERGVTT